MHSRNYDHYIKINMAGNTYVGKSSIVTRYAKSLFEENPRPTIGCEWETTAVNHGGRRVKLCIWDTAGEERYMALTKNFFRNSKAAFFVYDVTNRKSFEDIED